MTLASDRDAAPNPPRVRVMLPWEYKVIYFLTLRIVLRCNALANDATWGSLFRTLKRLDKWNTHCVLAMLDHVHLLTVPLEPIERQMRIATGRVRSSAANLGLYSRKVEFTFARISCTRGWSRIGRSGHIAMDFVTTKFEIWNCHIGV